MNKLIGTILQECHVRAVHLSPVSGGDINRAYCITEKDRKLFLKINDADRYPGMFEKEASGLLALKENSGLFIPEVFQSGIVSESQYLLMEWIAKGKSRPDFASHFGRQLALMHQVKQPFFGFKEDNYIGSLPQNNNRSESWSEFYSEYRIKPLVRLLCDSGSFTEREKKQTEKLSAGLKNLFPEEPPSLLHGDLWGGNYMITANGYAALYDPAVYYGHREMDIGMTRLFGGFDQEFYEGYNEIIPLSPGWQQRINLTQLYPLLVHAVLFGGHYIRSASEIISYYS